ncbi:MAG: UDP-N-acetylmuramate dehydrogenase [Lachnospiraceae bacterium]|nr:UDP-N-acetylmuramate dehydrogenase [Lachnospiraceae bacterium]
MNNEIIDLLKNVLQAEDILINEPMSKHTTFKIGGACDVFVTPRTIEQIKKVINICAENNVDYYVIGRGSNLLVSDKGYRGVIICIANNFDDIDIELSDDYGIVTAKAGAPLTKLSREIANKSLSGFEFASGIPGTLGGGVAMNAGAYGGEIKDCIVSATVLVDNKDVITLSKDELELGYRTSIIQKKGYIVLEAVFKFTKGDKEQIRAIIEDLSSRRKEKQPLEYPSAGSTFKRPEGYFAGKLIMDAGLRGYRVGDAMVSEKHCGFVVNVGTATANDVKKLIEDVKNKVNEKFNVVLEPEVRIIGEF